MNRLNAQYVTSYKLAPVSCNNCIVAIIPSSLPNLPPSYLIPR